jgi:hypothetical protein
MSEENTNELPPENYGDPNHDVMAAMDAFFDGPQAGLEPTPVAPDVTPDPVAAVPDAPVDVKDEPEDTTPVIEEEFFSDAPETPTETKEPVKEGAFNEEAFDKQTEEEVKGMEAKAGEKFRALKAELKAAKQSTVTPEVQAKLQELELKTAEIDGLKAKLTEVSSQSAKLKVESEDVYQREVVQPAAAIFTQADQLSERLQLDPQILRQIIKERDPVVQEELMSTHFGEASLVIQSKVLSFGEKFGDLIEKREQMMANAESELERQKVQRIESERKLLADQRASVQTLQKSIWDKYKEVIPGFVDEDGETPKFKELVAKGLAIDFSRAKANDMAFAAFAGSALPHAMKELVSLKKRLAVYEKEDVKSVRTSAKAGGSVQATKPDGNKPKDFMEAMASDYAFTH